MKTNLFTLIFLSLFCLGFVNGVPPGFDENGEDINECASGEHNCLPCMRCVNTYGSFLCEHFPDCDEEHGTGSVGRVNYMPMDAEHCGVDIPNYVCLHNTVPDQTYCTPKKCPKCNKSGGYYTSIL